MPLDLKKKGLVSVIIKKLNGMEELHSKSGDDLNVDDGLQSAADEMMSALKNNDSQSFKVSLQNFIQLMLDEMDNMDE